MPWVHASLRGSKVLARVDEKGAFVVEGGRVEVRYKPNDGRKYGARADNLTVVSGQILPEETCGPADAVADAKAAGSKGGAASARKGPSAGDAKADAPAPDGAIHIYADGACSGNPGPAGVGIVVLDSESRVEISEYIGKGTNNIAELTAILRALGEIADSSRPAIIHTDSSYSIGVLQKGWKAKANQDLVGELRDLLKRRGGIRLVYVPGHAGVKWNERADSLARAAVESKSSLRHVVRATPPSQITR